MIKIKDVNKFSDKFVSKLLENGFDFMKEEELKIYILYLFLEDGRNSSSQTPIFNQQNNFHLNKNAELLRSIVDFCKNSWNII